jgi:undecaprenyl-diphosphatase
MNLKRIAFWSVLAALGARSIGIALHFIHRRQADAPKVWLPARVEPSTHGRGLFVAVNASSGSEDGSVADRLRDLLPEAEVQEVEIVDGTELRKALDAAAENAVALGIAGGDGSINTAAQVAIDYEKPLAVFPSGTLNHLTRSIGLETVEQAVTAIQEGHAVGIDVATIDGHVFLNTASLGSYVELVDAREKLEGKIGKWAALLVSLLRVLRTSEPIEIEIDGRRAMVWMTFIGNCRYQPSGFAPTWRERLDDESLDFRYIDGSSPWARTRLVVAILTGRLGRSKVYRQTVVKELRIRSLQGPLRLARDGETFEGTDDIIVRKLPQRVAVYAQHDDAAG